MEEIFFQKLNGSRLVKKLPAFCGTRTFIAAFTRARHLPYSELRQSKPSSHFPKIHLNIILASTLQFFTWSHSLMAKFHNKVSVPPLYKTPPRLQPKSAFRIFV